MPDATLDLTAPLPDLGAWVARFRGAEIPVLAQTAEALEAMRANEDGVDANQIGEMVAVDPLMTLKVLAHAAAHRPARVVTDTETVTAALVMMGIGPFFRAFGPQRSIDEHLAGRLEALQGLDEVIRRAHRGATFGLAFAVHRMDPDAAVIHEAALLHDFAEMLLWCHAPALALRIREAQLADPGLRSSEIQRRLLNIELPDLQQALMKAWHLPELLVRISDDRHAEQASVRNVLLAVRLARHTARGWDNAALPDDVADIAALLNLAPPAALQLLRSIEN
ncbi:HDOD domain-containing protein [Piscinibacter defluvii]|uniref:HDOD domain-containing protein n=1 Tax=Piscinibacter defluvii TaxID=1796922 RepID=UPI000FDF35BC|nr:HDOD domain-containing protein [Piscinibacter defluvii]